MPETPKYTQQMDETPLNLKIVELSQTIEVTEFGKNQLRLIRDAIIEAKAYNRFGYTSSSLYDDVAKDALLTGQLVLIDILEEFIQDPTSSIETNQ